MLKWLSAKSQTPVKAPIPKSCFADPSTFIPLLVSASSTKEDIFNESKLDSRNQTSAVTCSPLVFIFSH